MKAGEREAGEREGGMEACMGGVRAKRGIESRSSSCARDAAVAQLKRRGEREREGERGREREREREERERERERENTAG